MKPQPVPDAPLPRRDLWLLPLISILTVAVLLCASEVVARYAWPEALQCTCVGPDGSRDRNCTAYAKTAEGSSIAYHFNECGYRTMESCGAKPPNSVRFVVLGTSVAEGWAVSYENTFSVRAARSLSAVFGRPVEFQNMGSLLFPLRSTADFIPKALELQADAILLVLTPYDLNRLDPNFHLGADPGNLQAAPSPVPQPGFSFRAALQRVRLTTRKSRAVLVIQHYLLRDETTTIDLYRSYNDPNDALHQQWSKVCDRRFAEFESMLDKVAGRLRGSRCPFFVVLVPSRIQAALMVSGAQIPGVDPYALFHRMRLAATSRGLGFVDVSPEFSQARFTPDLYYPVDSHPAAKANELVAQAVIRSFGHGRMPGLQTASYAFKK
jgi:hypothetical protein